MNPVFQKDSFLFFKESISENSILGDRLIIESKKLSDTIEYINSNKIKSIIINSEYYKLENLAFLEKIIHLEGIYLLSEDIDVTFVNSLHNLRVLSIGKIKIGKVDLSNFLNLEVLSYYDNNKIKGVSFCKELFWLWIDSYKKKDLIELKDLLKLRYLNLNSSSIDNLHGIEKMHKLQKIKLDTMRSLHSLSGININLDKLEVIDIWNAKQLTNYDEISKIKSLKQLELRQTGETESISFIKGLSNLETITIGFKVIDGNMNYLKGIPKVGFIDFAHYTQKMKDFIRK